MKVPPSVHLETVLHEKSKAWGRKSFSLNILRVKKKFLKGHYLDLVWIHWSYKFLGTLNCLSRTALPPFNMRIPVGNIFLFALNSLEARNLRPSGCSSRGRNQTTTVGHCRNTKMSRTPNIPTQCLSKSTGMQIQPRKRNILIVAPSSTNLNWEHTDWPAVSSASSWLETI